MAGPLAGSESPEDDSAGRHHASMTSVSASSAHAAPAENPWGDLGVDLVNRGQPASFLEARRRWERPISLRGAKTRAGRAPSKDGSALNLVMGDQRTILYDRGRSTASSRRHPCNDENGLAPVVKVVHEAIAIRPTGPDSPRSTIPPNTNLVVDGVHKDLRGARARPCSRLQPTTTGGSATAIALIYPELERQARRSCRAALRCSMASLTDCVFEMGAGDQRRGINDLFAIAASGPAPRGFSLRATPAGLDRFRR